MPELVRAVLVAVRVHVLRRYPQLVDSSVEPTVAQSLGRFGKSRVSETRKKPAENLVGRIKASHFTPQRFHKNSPGPMPKISLYGVGPQFPVL